MRGRSIGGRKKKKKKQGQDVGSPGEGEGQVREITEQERKNNNLPVVHCTVESRNRRWPKESFFSE